MNNCTFIVSIPYIGKNSGTFRCSKESYHSVLWFVKKLFCHDAQILRQPNETRKGFAVVLINVYLCMIHSKHTKAFGVFCAQANLIQHVDHFRCALQTVDSIPAGNIGFFELGKLLSGQAVV